MGQNIAWTRYLRGEVIYEGDRSFRKEGSEDLPKASGSATKLRRPSGPLTHFGQWGDEVAYGNSVIIILDVK
jgi:hypothetical protein